MELVVHWQLTLNTAGGEQRLQEHGADISQAWDRRQSDCLLGGQTPPHSFSLPLLSPELVRKAARRSPQVLQQFHTQARSMRRDPTLLLCRQSSP